LIHNYFKTWSSSCLWPKL